MTNENSGTYQWACDKTLVCCDNSLIGKSDSPKHKKNIVLNVTYICGGCAQVV